MWISLLAIETDEEHEIMIIYNYKIHKTQKNKEIQK